MDFQNREDGFREMPHSADLALQVWAANLTGLFTQATKGMYTLLRIKRSKGSKVHRIVEFHEIDFENLLVSFLTELLNDLQQNKKVYEQFQLDINHLSLIGNLYGRKIKGIGREIKAVTYHNLKILKTRSGYRTTIVFDI